MHSEKYCCNVLSTLYCNVFGDNVKLCQDLNHRKKYLNRIVIILAQSVDAQW
uniref:Uncharacterized protein n=1 Tax=Anguilla anguilla TaxID=7936 RepID=A0A0E9SMK9_ANGAN